MDEEITTVLGKGSRFEGKLTFEGTVRIDGRFSGEIQTEGTLIIGDSAEVEANIFASIVVVKGHVRGDVVAGESLKIQAPAKVVGNLSTPNLTIETGSFFEGHCKMSGDRASVGVGEVSRAPAEG
ncbi:bactofilin family protein [Enhygromyxa salina]|uniref:Polymer-forming cytoskeletal n=1 Tax=Enhygromyxa salina TaxID=215803 RepID=A0A2S9YQS8_9BACT|nr:polymer-forming cytoskeletal protein [Enhygromyxa salina]PRQ07419.1 Polymer-forming cytoskeletal [Enhygromyxa salina]